MRCRFPMCRVRRCWSGWCGYARRCRTMSSSVRICATATSPVGTSSSRVTRRRWSSLRTRSRKRARTSSPISTCRCRSSAATTRSTVRLRPWRCRPGPSSISAWCTRRMASPAPRPVSPRQAAMRGPSASQPNAAWPAPARKRPCARCSGFTRTSVAPMPNGIDRARDPVRCPTASHTRASSLRRRRNGLWCRAQGHRGWPIVSGRS